MKMYADTPLHRARQILGDLLLIGWLVGWAWIGIVVHDGTMQLARPGEQIASSATGMAEGLASAGEKLEGIPVIGGGVSAPFGKAADASTSLAGAGRAQVRAVERLAFWLGLSIALIPILTVSAFYLPLRARFIRRASAGARFIDANEDLDLFALRALSRQPMHVLARISSDPAGAWRTNDSAVVRRLAELELRECGLRLPPAASLGTS